MEHLKSVHWDGADISVVFVDEPVEEWLEHGLLQNLYDQNISAEALQYAALSSIAYKQGDNGSTSSTRNKALHCGALSSVEPSGVCQSFYLHRDPKGSFVLLCTRETSPLVATEMSAKKKTAALPRQCQVTSAAYVSTHVDFGGIRPFGGPGRATVDRHGRQTGGKGQGRGRRRRASDLGRRRRRGGEDGAREGAEEVTDKDAEVGGADWADDDDEAKAAEEKGAAEEDDAPAHEEAARDSDTHEGEDVATEDADEASDEDAAADHDLGTDNCFRGDQRLVF